MALGNLSIGAIALLIGAVLLIYRFMANPKRKDAVMTGAVVLLVVGFFIGGTAAFNEITGLVKTSTQTVTGAGAQVSIPAGAGIACERQTDGTNTLNLVYRNAENSSLGYLAASVVAEVDGESQASGTTTAGASLSYLSLNVPPCQSGKIYSLESTTIASTVKDYSSFELTSNYELNGAESSVVNVQARDSTLAKASSGYANGTTEASLMGAISGVGATDGNAYYKNTSFSAGSSLNFYIDYAVNRTTGAFGAMVNGQPATDGVIFSFDSVDASKFSANALSFVSDTAGITLKKVPCPASIAANRNAEACWQTRTLLATDGEIRLRGTLKADLGDPAADSSDSPKLAIDEQQYFRDTDGDVKYSAFNAAGTNMGLGGTIITFVTN